MRVDTAINPRNASITTVGVTDSGRVALVNRTWVWTVADLDGDSIDWSKTSTSNGSVSVTQLGYVFTINYTISRLTRPAETFTVTLTDRHGSTVQRNFTF